MKGMATVAQEVSKRSLEECRVIAQTVKKQVVVIFCLVRESGTVVKIAEVEHARTNVWNPFETFMFFATQIKNRPRLMRS